MHLDYRVYLTVSLVGLLIYIGAFATMLVTRGNSISLTRMKTTVAISFGGMFLMVASLVACALDWLWS